MPAGLADVHLDLLPIDEQLTEVAEGEVAAILGRSDTSLAGSILKRLKLTIR